MILIFLTLALIVFIYYRIQETRKCIEVFEEWQECLGNFHISTQEFYDCITDILIFKKINKLKIRRVTFYEEGWPSRKREYLFVRRKKTCFLISGYVFGSDYYICVRQGYKKLPELETQFLSSIPIIRDIVLHKPKLKTYFQIDTEKAFMDTVRKSIITSCEFFKNPYAYRSNTSS